MFEQHNLEKFKEQLFYSGKLKTNIYYVVLVKIRKGDVYYTAGKRQYSLYFNDFQDKNFERFFEFLTQILNKLFEEYDNELDYSCDSKHFKKNLNVIKLIFLFLDIGPCS